LSFLTERLAIINTGKNILSEQLTVGTWGNISCCLTDNLVAITPSGIEYGLLRPEDIVIMQLNGKIIDGLKKPSSETGLHLAIYKQRPDIKALVHTHSPYASVFATLRQDIGPFLEDQVQIIGGTIKVADYALPGSNELNESVLKALGSRYGVILANHGALGGGRHLDEALLACRIIEKSAMTYALAANIGRPHALEPNIIEHLRSFYLEKYAPFGKKGRPR